jgi:hypothetical protein
MRFLPPAGGVSLRNSPRPTGEFPAKNGVTESSRQDSGKGNAGQQIGVRIRGGDYCLNIITFSESVSMLFSRTPIAASLWVLLIGGTGAGATPPLRERPEPVEPAEWTEFRGPTGQGHSSATGLPLTWSDTENVKWKSGLSGKGWSSPVIQSEQIWLTIEASDRKTLSAVCLARQTGERLHEVVVAAPAELGTVHDKNTLASPIRRPAISDPRRPQEHERRTRMRLSQVFADRGALRCRSSRTAASSRRDRIFVASTRIDVPMCMRCFSQIERFWPRFCAGQSLTLGAGGRQSRRVAACVTQDHMPRRPVSCYTLESRHAAAFGRSDWSGVLKLPSRDQHG